MKTYFCKGYVKKKYPIYYSEDESFADLFSLIPPVQKKFVVIDKAIIKLFPQFVKKLQKESFLLFPIEATEDNKTFEGLQKLCTKIFSLKPSRDDIIISIGGGLVMNLGGLTSSLVMRGLKFYYVPTTLTGQIDACMGSKQAVNFMGAKNWIGMFNDPEFCYINPLFLLKTPERELNSQAIEGVKLCLATNKKLFYEIFDNLQSFHLQSFSNLSQFVEKMIQVKLPIVKIDLLEENYGMSMLYGHTVGHAIEMIGTNISHGEGVGLGMLVAAHISVLIGLANENLITTHEQILKRLNIIYKIPKDIKIADIIHLLDYNKKNYNGEIHFLLLKNIGEMAHKGSEYFTIVPKEIVEKAIQNCY